MPQKSSNFSLFVSDYISELTHCLNCLDSKQLEAATQTILAAFKQGKTIFIMGNGGSASNASHMAADLGKGTLRRHYDNNEARIRVLSLTDNVAIMTAFGNDVAFEDIFFQQLRNLVTPHDVVIALSGSGNSQNLIKAVKYAHSQKAKTIGVLGFKTGGKLAKLVDYPILIDSLQYGPCEDIQLVIDHMMTGWIGKIKREHQTAAIKKQNA